MDNKTIGISFTVDQAARKLFESCLPNDMLIVKQDPDIGIDYLIELTEEGEPTGKKIAVQLKGTQKLQTSKGLIVFALKSKHLVYYRDKCKDPVYLIIFNTITKNGYWLFLQEYINKHVTEAKLKQQKISVKIPFNNIINPPFNFITDSHGAEKYMRDYHSTSIMRAINNTVAEYKNLDDRFLIRLNYEEDDLSVNLRAKEEIGVKLLVRNEYKEKFENELKNVMEFGLSSQIDLKNVKIEGSPLLETLFSQADSLLISSPIIKILCIIKTVNNEKNIGTILYNIQGNAIIASKKLEFKGNLSNIFNISLTIFPSTQKGLFSVTCQMSYSFANFINKPFFSVPQIDQLYKFFEECFNGSNLQIELEENGILKLGTPIDLGQDRVIIKYGYENLNILYKSKKIFEFYKLNPPFPDIDNLTLNTDIDVLYALITFGVYEESVANFLLTCQMLIAPHIDASVFNKDEPFIINFSQKDFNILGNIITETNISWEIKNAKLMNKEALEKISEGTSVELQWKGDKTSSLRIYKNTRT